MYSGDDRDYCEIRHSISIDGTESFIPEISVKSFSPAKDASEVGVGQKNTYRMDFYAAGTPWAVGRVKGSFEI